MSSVWDIVGRGTDVAGEVGNTAAKDLDRTCCACYPRPSWLILAPIAIALLYPALAAILLVLIGLAVLATWLLAGRPSWRGSTPSQRAFLAAGAVALAVGLGLGAFAWPSWLSDRASTTTMPDFDGRSAQSALTALTSQGFGTVVLNDVNGDESPDPRQCIVGGSIPAPGNEVDKREEVELIVECPQS